MEVWERLLDKFGLPLAMLAAFIFFFWKGVWPFLQDQIREARESGKEDQREFMAALARRDELVKEELQAFRDGLRKMDEQRGKR
jgi:hypothetical protein